MIFHIARTDDIRRHRRAALELVEDDAIGLAHHGGQHVQTATVRHANDDIVDAQSAAALDDLFERGDRGLTAIQTKALGAGETLVQEALKALGLDQLLEDRHLALRREGDFLVLAFDPLLQPLLFDRIGDVHILHADIATVGAAQDRDDLTHRAGLEAQHII